MVGSAVGPYPLYTCTKSMVGAVKRCGRYVAAGRLEKFVEERAVELLELWPPGLATGPLVVAETTPESVDARVRSIPSSTSTDDVAEAADSTTKSARARHQRISVRRADALDGVIVGADARLAWLALPQSRKRAALRLLFDEIRIGPKSTPRNTFDEGRIDVVVHPAWRAVEDGQQPTTALLSKPA